MLSGRDVQRGIHRIALKLHIAAVLDGEGLQRDDRQRIFHLASIQGIAPREVETLVIILHAEVTTAHEVDIVRLFNIEVADNVGTMIHGDGQIGIKSCRYGLGDDGLDGIAEIGKLHQLVETVIGREGRVEEHVGHIRRTEHFETASHVELLKWSLHARQEIHVGLTEGDTLGFLLRIDQQEVCSPHTHIHRDTVHIREIDIAHHVDRLVVIGIESEVLEQQTGIDDTHRVVVKAHADAIRLTYQIGILDIDFTINLRMFQCALDGQFAFGKALETYNLVCDESVAE